MRVKSYILVFLCLFFCSFARAQKASIDTLLKVDKEDTNKVNHLRGIAWDYRNIGEYKKAKSFADSSVALAQKLNYTKGIGDCYNTLASVYYMQGDYPNTLNTLLTALNFYEKLNDKGGAARIYGNMGLIYKQQGDYKKAMEFYEKGLKVHEDLNDKDAIATVEDNMGNLYDVQKDTVHAMQCFLIAIKTYKESNNKGGLAISLSNIGGVYVDEKNYAKGLKYYQDALAIYNEIEDKSGASITDNNLGYVYFIQKNYAEAEKYCSQSLAIAKSIGDPEATRHALDNLSDIYARTGRWKEALDAGKEFNSIKDSLVNQSKSKEIGKLEAKAEYDKQLVVQQAEEDKKAALSQAESNRQKIIILFATAIAIAIAIIALVIFRSLRITREQKVLIEQQKNEVEQQKTVVEEKNKEIVDSINYAKRLQDAILPPLTEVKKYLPESFVLYKPKDIVAGDFYWLAISGEGQVFIAAADCTGHGVPGAMVSVVCSNALNRTVKECGITEPGKILDKVRELVLETFEKSEGDIKDGMDISLASLTYWEGNTVLKWAGAYNSLWYVQDKEMKEITGDKQPIGKTDNPKPFTTHALNLRKGTAIYLFTDGYADQFGGEKGKKFKYKQMQENILGISGDDMQSQGRKLDRQFEDWKGFLDQVDDVLVMGIRV